MRQLPASSLTSTIGLLYKQSGSSNPANSAIQVQPLLIYLVMVASFPVRLRLGPMERQHQLPRTAILARASTHLENSNFEKYVRTHEH